MSSEALRFGSRAYIEAMAEAFQAIVVERPQLDGMVVCEVYENAPADIANVGADIAWTMRVLTGRIILDWRECADEEAHVKSRGDYHALRAIAQFIVTPENEGAYETMIARAEESGKMQRIKALPPGAKDHTVHNALAARTI